MQRAKEAQKIYQDLLDDIGRAYFENDFAAFATYIDVPHITQTFDKTYTIATQDDLKSLFDKLRAELTALGVTDYIRTCLSAEFLQDDIIRGAHVTHIMQGGTYLQEPYPVLSHLTLRDGRWWVTRSENAVDTSKMIGMALRHGLKPNTAGPNETETKDD